MKVICKFPNGFPYDSHNRVEFWDLVWEGMTPVNITNLVAPMLQHWWSVHCGEEITIVCSADCNNNHIIVEPGESYTISDFLRNVADVFSDVRLFGYADKQWHEHNL